jgi:hypothetical protein
MLQIYPAVRLNRELAAQLAEARQSLRVPADDAQVEANLRAKLAAMQTKLAEQSSAFIAAPEVSIVLNHLYGYADENGVQIAKVEAASTSGRATTKAKGVDVQSFQVEVSGPTLQLIGFVASLKEASLPSVVIDQLVIARGKGPQGASTLTIILQLYTSPSETATASTTPQP